MEIKLSDLVLPPPTFSPGENLPDQVSPPTAPDHTMPPGTRDLLPPAESITSDTTDPAPSSPLSNSALLDTPPDSLPSQRL